MTLQSQNTRLKLQVNPAEFVAFCDGLEAAGLVEYAQRGRCVARDLAAAQRRVGELERDVGRLTVERDEWRTAAFLAKHGQPWPT